MTYDESTRRVIAREYLDGDEPSGAVAARYRVSATTVRHWARTYFPEERKVTGPNALRRDTEGKPLFYSVKWAIVDQLRNGASVRQVAEAFGMSAGYVLYWLRRTGFSDWIATKPKPEYAAGFKRQVAERCETGLFSYRQIAEEHGVSPASVKRWHAAYLCGDL